MMGIKFGDGIATGMIYHVALIYSRALPHPPANTRDGEL